MRYIIAIVFSLISLSVFGQGKTIIPNRASDSLFLIGVQTRVLREFIVDSMATNDTNVVAGFNTSGKMVKRYKSSGGSADSTIFATNYRVDTAKMAIRTDITGRLKYTDSADMLLPYLRKTDTASLSNRIDARVKYSDTDAMLAPYVPYTGATGNVNLGTHSLTAKRVNTDTLEPNSSAGLHLHNTSHQDILIAGAGGGQNLTIYAPTNFDLLKNLSTEDTVLTTNSSGTIQKTGIASTYLKSATAATTYVSLSGTYTNPSWIVSLPWSKITSPPTTLSGYGITDAQSALGYTPENVANKATSFATQNNTLYPSVLAVKNYVDAAIAAIDYSNYVTLSYLGTWTGSTNITTVGTIATGTWNATTISTGKGGTGLASIGTANQVMGVNSGATGLEYKSFATGTSGTDFAIAHSANTVTFNIPTASSSNRGLLSSANWTTFNSKIGGSGSANFIPSFSGTSTLTRSPIQADGSNIGVGVSVNASYRITTNGLINASGFRTPNNGGLANTSNTAINIISNSGSGITYNVPDGGYVHDFKGGTTTIARMSSGKILVKSTTDRGTGALEVTGNISVLGTTGNTYRWDATSGTPSNTVTPAGWVKINIAGSDAWLPYYQ